MVGSKIWDGKRVRLLKSYASAKCEIKAGEVVTLHKVGVVRMQLETDDGRVIEVGKSFQQHCFAPADIDALRAAVKANAR